jgi:FHS family Na+ dependent glucose MFS transporter 1
MTSRVSSTRRSTIGYFATFVAIGLSASVVGPTLPSLAAQTGSQLAQISLVFTALSLGYLVGSLGGGRLYDRMAGHPVVAGGLVVAAASLALVPSIPWLWLMVVAMLFLGMATGAVDVGGNTLLVWLYGGRVGPYMNSLHFFFGVGAFLSPVIIAQVLTWSGGTGWAYRLLAVLMLPAAVWLFWMPSPAAPSRGAGAGGHSAAATSLRASQRPLLIMIVGLFFLYVGVESGFAGWIYSYAVALGLSDQATAAYLTSAFWGALTAGRLLGVPIASRVRPRTILLADLVGCVASVGVLLVWQGSPLAAWLGTCGAGFSMATFFPTLIALAERHMTITGQITGWFLAGSSAGGMTLPWLMGQLFEWSGPRSVMVAILIDLVVAVGLFAILIVYSDRQGQQVPESA